MASERQRAFLEAYEEHVALYFCFDRGGFAGGISPRNSSTLVDYVAAAVLVQLLSKTMIVGYGVMGAVSLYLLAMAVICLAFAAVCIHFVALEK